MCSLRNRRSLRICSPGSCRAQVLSTSCFLHCSKLADRGREESQTISILTSGTHRVLFSSLLGADLKSSFSLLFISVLIWGLKVSIYFQVEVRRDWEREGKQMSLSSVVFLLQELDTSSVRLEAVSSTLTVNKLKCSQFLSNGELEPPLSRQLF